MSAFFITIAVVLFLLFIVPVWLWLHYSTKRRTLSRQDIERLHQLVQQSQRMQQRIATLEAILDVEDPNWRDQP